MRTKSKWKGAVLLLVLVLALVLALVIVPMVLADLSIGVVAEVGIGLTVAVAAGAMWINRNALFGSVNRFVSLCSRGFSRIWNASLLSIPSTITGVAHIALHKVAVSCRRQRCMIAHHRRGLSAGLCKWHSGSALFGSVNKFVQPT